MPVSYVVVEGALPLIRMENWIESVAPPDRQDSSANTTAYTPPRNTKQNRSLQTSGSLLNVERVGIYDNFFELGGHSLLGYAGNICDPERAQCGSSGKGYFCVPHRCRTELTMSLSKRTKPRCNRIAKRNAACIVPLSFSQERLWFIDQLEGSVAYHIPVVLRLKGILNIEAFQDALREVVNRHESLRTVISEVDGQGYQYILPLNSWKLAVTNGAAHPDEIALHDYVRSLIRQPFKLSEEHMFGQN